MWTTLPAGSTTTALMPARQARETAPTPAGTGGGYIWWSPQKHAGVRVTAHDIFKIAVAWRCIQFVASSHAQIDWNVYESLPDGGKLYRPDHGLDWVIDRQVNDEFMAAFTWRELVINHAMSKGGHFSEIEREPRRNRPVALWPLTPERVRPTRTAAGRLVYDVQNPGAPNKVLDAEDVFHIRGPSWDGILGYDAAFVGGEMFGVALAAQRHAGSFFANDATPGGVLATEQVLGEPAIKRLRADWQTIHRGPHNAYMMAILEQGLKWLPTGVDPQKAQLNETQESLAYRICGFFGVPPHCVGLMKNSAKANMEQQGREAVQYGLKPWGRRLESEADMKLLGRREGNHLYTEFDYSILQSADTQTLTNHIMAMMDRGVYCVNESRYLLKKNPITEAEGGKKRLFPQNFTTLDRAGEQPIVAPTKPGGTPGDSPGAGADNRPTPSRPLAAMLTAARGVLVSTLSGLFTKEALAAKRELGKAYAKAAKPDGFDKPAFPDAISAFYVKHRAAVEKSLRPVAELATSLGLAVDAAAWADDLTGDAETELRMAYETDSLVQLQDRLDHWHEGRAVAAADRLLGEPPCPSTRSISTSSPTAA